MSFYELNQIISFDLNSRYVVTLYLGRFLLISLINNELVLDVSFDVALMSCSTLQMLTNIENRLEDLFEMIEMMPPDRVEMAEKVCCISFLILLHWCIVAIPLFLLVPLLKVHRQSRTKWPMEPPLISGFYSVK